MLNEYVVTPDVFDALSYEDQGACGVSLRWLKDAILEDGLVRDLRDGGWSRHCAEGAAQYHRSTKELLAKLRSNNRLRPFDPQLAAEPANAAEWLQEGLASHAEAAVDGIITSHVSAGTTTERQVVSVEKLTGAGFWQSRSPSRTLTRSAASYAAALAPILRQSRSLMFIDPYLDPSTYNFRDFTTLLQPLLARRDRPIIEFHRSFVLDEQVGRTFPSAEAWRSRFDALHCALAAHGLTAEVFAWQKFHDRFLIADVFGLNASSGFDTTSDSTSTAVWSRLGRADREAVQREFDPAVRGADCKHRFRIGAP